jgi:bis(5'-nucleosyl)-tetraphosphatase (symmetrical)
MRYCTPRGRIGIEDKGTPGTQEQGLYPWFEVPGRAERDLKIVCGHWSALGLTITQGVHAIDTGAVWGGKLTALQLDTDELRVVQVPGRDVPKPVSAPRPPARRPAAEGTPPNGRPPRQGQGQGRDRGRGGQGRQGGGTKPAQSTQPQPQHSDVTSDAE